MVSRYSLTLVGWTEIGRKIQSLSKPCPMSVQSHEKYRVCPKSVEVLSNSEALGQRLDIEIQLLTKYCPIKGRKKLQISVLD